ncbi:tRNA-uridine aminocarboxypropyltransferase [Shewanella sp. 1_MG-2023]|uniref:tRNA-uridine aminocarboxypropyltransferase n=1 Tax=unclassified Shewanella TaxID=196818 RepID=UPI0026E136C9|nr:MULTISPECIES: tRNA-uridine aminocarboxypropyltransferase [unclassified Shewanella]MDO6611633.1 tRNA-uridine aminocarboxypropyltransferase [Shewanella sp. 7_MG-2023]MDO6771488.1 tRNA-uridine aminocarboxypropyltransferase [Shewanella sp. 2_MG-2023]MDO6793863.1 tRNA-uridine aminocarboxypropyltransferase [Shewanella sp. 1_MG-2023]
MCLFLVKGIQVLKIILLTHQKELTRPSNTGRWVKAVLEERALVIPWDRVNPNPELTQLIASAKVGLLFPELPAQPSLVVGSIDSAERIDTSIRLESDTFSNFDALVIIDSTWQEARKIYNRSPYLKQLKKVSIDSKVESIYQLRRNQLEGGLCTAECAAHILSQVGELESAESIMKCLKEQIAHKMQ